ncbi:MAG: hypothetical protein A3G24_25010 [Betaproteobacteria bacterium RIFCSPLOWO2_12_FULL_62_13]|nr:MAG: hypothetical protein A3G24_25010 [Betaproteobacteria bacterium RIFCSPLOWO2_12_FULL_62_13]
MREDAPNLEGAYRQYKGLLFSALGKLAAQGFAVPPDDAADLVHDFFAEAWDGIAERYEPKRAGLGTYVYAAFVRFARPRIVRLQRFHGSLMEPKELERLTEAESDAPEPENALDLQRLHEAMIALPSRNRELLEYWLKVPSGSEREAARSLGLSRYQARLQLIDALGQVSVAIGALGSVERIDRDVALAVWRDGRTIAETSARLHSTAQQVCNAYRRNQRRLERTLSFIRGTQVQSKRSEAMSPTKIEELIERIYKEYCSKDLVQEIKSHAPELVEYLGKTESARPLSWEELPADWLADVYAAIAAGLGTDFEPAVDKALFSADAKDRESVGRAFFEVLVPAGAITSLVELCKHQLKQVSDQAHARLAHESDVKAGGQPAVELAAFGLTPTHLVLATDAVALLLERAIDAGFFPGGRPLFLRLSTSGSAAVTCEGQKDGLTQSELVDEIAAFAEVDEKTSAVLLHWAVKTAEFIPYLFVGFRATFTRDALELTQLKPEEPPINLFQRWNSRKITDPFNVEIDTAVKQGHLERSRLVR